MSDGLEDTLKAVRWPAVVVVTTILASMAAARDDVADASQQPGPQGQWEVFLSPQTEGTSGKSAPQEEPPPVPDRRDRIFYPGDTERIKPLGRKLVLNILLDQKEIFTSPFHINPHNARWWLLFGATTGGLMGTDGDRSSHCRLV